MAPVLGFDPLHAVLDRPDHDRLRLGRLCGRLRRRSRIRWVDRHGGRCEATEACNRHASSDECRCRCHVPMVGAKLKGVGSAR
jgi:hypothetical protein